MVTKRLHNSCLALRPRNRWEDLPFGSSLLFPLILHTSCQYLQQSSFPLSSRHLPVIFLLSSRRHLTFLSSVPLSNPASFRYLQVLPPLVYLPVNLTSSSPVFLLSSRHLSPNLLGIFPLIFSAFSPYRPLNFIWFFP
jgi:hypothetical protein